ncbi:MAG TPA: transcriptional regulator [Methanobacteriales archaeon]|nr:MAG: Putative HTH-type transcriptional regulatory protein [Methanobacteriaceae archaeon 41_258]MBC7089452.1 transcriptional regulator [Methanobacteriaceae archaeon]MBC7096911.1 transcriptional regulator [Methanobacteriales archaeon]HIH61709.1 transcriptional regulator [Methanobacteriales archaeon]
MNREKILQELYDILTTHGFKVSHIYERSCFDLLARKKLLLLLKVLVNIDSINSLQAHEIKKVAYTFLAAPLIIGLKSKTDYLEEDVVYERHGIPAIALKTLKNMIMEDHHPEVFADRGGYYVQIDGNTLREVREEYNMSLKDLADIAHVSRETIYKYENGLVRASPETAMILEEILNIKIILSIDLFKAPEFDKDIMENKPDKRSEKLVELGFGVVQTQKAPFDALAKDMKFENTIIADLEKNRDTRTLKRMAVPLKDISLVTGSDAVFILKNPRIRESFEGIPVIKDWEINEIESSKEFLKIIAERKEYN